MADGSFKINCDASFSKSGAAIACVIRDASSQLIDFFGKRVNTSLAMVRETVIFCLKEGDSAKVLIGARMVVQTPRGL